MGVEAGVKSFTIHRLPKAKVNSFAAEGPAVTRKQIMCSSSVHKNVHTTLGFIVMISFCFWFINSFIEEWRAAYFINYIQLL